MRSLAERAATFLLNDLVGMCRKAKVELSSLDPKEIGVLIAWEHEGLITRKQVRDCVTHLLKRSTEQL